MTPLNLPYGHITGRSVQNDTTLISINAVYAVLMTVTWCNTASVFGIDRSKNLPWRVRENFNPKVYRRCRKIPCPNFVRWWVEPKQRFTVKELYVGECPCSTMNRQIGSDWGWKSSKTTKLFLKNAVFHTNLEQMFKRMASDLDIQPTTTWHRQLYVPKSVRLLLPQQYSQYVPPQKQLVMCKSGL